MPAGGFPASAHSLASVCGPNANATVTGPNQPSRQSPGGKILPPGGKILPPKGKILPGVGPEPISKMLPLSFGPSTAGCKQVQYERGVRIEHAATRQFPVALKTALICFESRSPVGP